MTSPVLGVGIIGPGAIAEVHAQAVVGLGHRVAAVAGPDRSHTAAFAERFGCDRIHSGADELVADSTVDAVIVASPNRLHVEHSSLAVRAGLPVLCEVPVATDLSTALGLHADTLASGQWVMVAHTLRYMDGYRRLRELVETEDFRISHLSARRLMLRHENVGWTGQRREWTDQVWWHHGAHLIDAALWFLGTDDAEICGQLGPRWPRTGEPMDAAAVLSTADGRIAGLSLSYHSRWPADEFVAIGADRTLVLRDGRLTDPGDAMPLGQRTDALAVAVRAQDHAFLTAAAARSRPPLELADVLPAIRLLQQVQDQADRACQAGGRVR